nr:hypothetical protein [Tanacetum cinerariifolium]
MSIDDLYNNFKIVKQEVKKNASSNSSSQNMAFVSSPSTNNTNEVYTAYELDLSNSGLKEFKQPKFEGYGPKTSKNVSEDIPNELKEHPDAPLVKDRVSNN